MNLHLVDYQVAGHVEPTSWITSWQAPWVYSQNCLCQLSLLMNFQFFFITTLISLLVTGLFLNYWYYFVLMYADQMCLKKSPISSRFSTRVQFLILLTFYLCVCICVSWHPGGGQRTTYRYQFYPSLIWAMGTGLRLSVCLASAISAEPSLQFMCFQFWN